MNNKKIVAMLVVLAAIAIVAVIAVAVKTGNVDTGTTISNQNPAKSSTASSGSNDIDAKALEDDLSAIDDDSFNADNLSDQNVGL